MSLPKAFRVFLILLLLLIILIPAITLGAESTHGYVRVVGYKDTIPTCGRRFAPYAIFADIPHAENSPIYLAYDYTRYGLYERVWLLWLTDGNRNLITSPENISVCLPYPSIWSAKDGAYWKWTKRYAEKHYDWYYSKGYESVFGVIRVNFHTRPRRAKELNEYGFMINLGTGFAAKSINIEFCPIGSDPPYGFIEDDEDEDDDW